MVDFQKMASKCNMLKVEIADIEKQINKLEKTYQNQKQIKINLIIGTSNYPVPNNYNLLLDHIEKMNKTYNEWAVLKERHNVNLKFHNWLVEFYNENNNKAKQLVGEIDRLERQLENTHTIKLEELSLNSDVWHNEVKKYAEMYLDNPREHDYTNLIFDCAKGYDNRVRSLSISDKSGTKLMDQSLASAKILSLKKNDSTTENNRQDGIYYMSKGMISGIRNVFGHEDKAEYLASKEECMQILGFISYLHSLLDECVYIEQ